MPPYAVRKSLAGVGPGRGIIVSPRSSGGAGMKKPIHIYHEDSHLTAGTSSKTRQWLALCVTKNIVGRALITSLIVGTILILINHGDALITGQIDTIRLLRMVLTYLVPYLVSTTSSVSTILSFHPHQRWERKVI
jgi:hypothetical protein